MNDDIKRSEAEPTFDPGGAIASLGSPTMPDKVKNRPGPKPGTPRSPNYGTKSDKKEKKPKGDATGKTRAELQAENEALQARLTMATLSGQELQDAKDCVQGLVTVLNMGAEFANLREFTFTPTEQNHLADLWAKPLSPYLGKLGKMQPWVAAVAGTAFLVWPKWVAYIDRLELDKKTAISAHPPGEASPVVEVSRVDGAPV
jgi:hypothetical protein